MSPTVDVTPMPTAAPAGNTAVAAGGETPNAGLFAALLGAVMPSGEGEVAAALLEQGTSDGEGTGEESEDAVVDPAAMGWAALFAVPQFVTTTTTAIAAPSLGTATTGDEAAALTLGDGSTEGDAVPTTAATTGVEQAVEALPTAGDGVAEGADAAAPDTAPDSAATDAVPARPQAADRPIVDATPPPVLPVANPARTTGTESDAGPAGEAPTEVIAAADQPVVPVTTQQAPVHRTEQTAATAETVAPRPAQPAVHQVVRAIGPVLEGPDGSYEMRVELRPPELGRVEVTVELRNGTVNISLHAERPQAVAALSSAIDELRDALRSGGVNPGNVSVDQQSRQQQPNTRSSRSGRADIGVAGVGDIDDDTDNPSVVTASSGDRALDVRM